MKYMLLIYSNPATWEHPMFMHQDEVLPEEEGERRMAEFAALLDEIVESGELIGTEALTAPAQATTVRVRDGEALPTDGPFAESKEQLAGYFIVDCASRERAVEIAARFPDARLCAVEVRPVVDRAEMAMCPPEW